MTLFLLLFIFQIFGLSLQYQLFRDFNGKTDQNLQGQGSQWTLSDPSGTPYSLSISTCMYDKFIVKPASVPIGTTLTKTFEDLEDHNFLRFYVKVHYFGEYTSQTLNIKFDQTSFETSKVLPLDLSFDPPLCPLPFAGLIEYSGTVSHSASSVTVEFSTNLHGTNVEVGWGLLSFSFITDISDTGESDIIYGFASMQEITIQANKCSYRLYYDADFDTFWNCNDPCEECYGPGPDKCFTYRSDSPLNVLCPTGQTFTSSGCTDCAVEKCSRCDTDVNQCETCLTTCAWCYDWIDPPQCQLCTVESNFVLYQGTCIESCPQGTYEDSEKKCQPCQPGCLDCQGPQECIQCDTSETTNIDGLCVCNEPRMYFQEGSGCTGNCFLSCEQCINEEECLICHSGLTLQPGAGCRCDNNGAYYEDDTGLCTGQCFKFCDYCHDATSCLSCSGNRIPQVDRCICDPLSRVLIGTNCECAADLIENPDTLNCDYNDLIDIAYQSTISPLFDAILQVQMNPRRKWTSITYITWTADCTYQNFDTKDLFQSYLFNQYTDILLIPSTFLEYKLQCSVKASYYNENGLEVSKTVAFQTLYPGQPQVHIHGGPFQMLTHTEVNFILAQVQSSVGKSLSPSDVKTTWTQTGGDTLDMTKLLSPSDPFRLTIPKCTLSRGKIYKFKLHVQLLVNPGSETSQEVNIGVYAPKIQTQITGLSDNYHLSFESLTLQAQLSLTHDECNQDALLLSDLIDSSTAMYAWECFYLDLEQFPPTHRLLDESNEITKDPSISRHPDPLKIFEQSTSSPTLTIPSSYFTGYSGYQFLFYLTVIVQGKDSTPSITKFNVQQPSLYTQKNKTHLHIVSSKPFTTVSFTCMSENNCQAFSDDFHTKFVGSNFNSHYSYKWLLNSLDPRSYNTFLTIVHLNADDPTIVPQILYTISDGTNAASAFFTLPWATPPKNGFVQVYPTSGDAYNTKFFLSTYGWADTDLPVSYQFWISSDPDPDALFPVLNKMLKTFSPYDETILLPPVPVSSFSYCLVGVFVEDNLKTTSKSQPTFVSLSNEAHSHCETVNKSSHALSLSKKADSLLQRFQLISVLLENLNKWESWDLDSPCIENGSEFKFTAVTEMKEIVLALNSKKEFKIAMLNSIVFGSDIDFTQDKNWQLYLDIVDSYYLSEASSSTSILSSEEYKPLFRLLDGLLWQMKTPGSGLKEDPEKIFLYINMFLRSTLSNQILPTDEKISFQGDFYTYSTVKTTYCKVLQDRYLYVPYAMEGLNANITLRANQSISQEKCNNEIYMIFMAFRPNTTRFQNTNYTFPQTLLYFDLVDSLTGKSLLDIYTFLLFSPTSFCPGEWLCHPGDGGEGTEIYGIFDLRNQINKIFAKSNIGQIQNISVLAHFQFWKSVAFWTVLAFSTWFLLSFYWLYVKHPTYCALTAHKSITTERLIKRLNLFFWVIHPLVGIYIYNDAKTAKPVKLAIYYQRLVLVMMFSTIFSTIEKGEGRVFKTYILLFNTLTVTPVNALLSRIFQKFFSMKNSKKKIPPKIQLFLGIFCYLALLVSCFIVMFIIEAQIEESQNKEWTLNFLISFFQDLSLSPAISIFNKVLFIKLSESDRFGKTLTQSPKVLALLLPETFTSIYKTIFSPPPFIKNMENIKDTCQSPRATTTTPLSSNRKFLKFTTLDVNSQTSSRVQTPLEFRTRVASENDINSVDLLPMETMISNRFQTLFSEGKIEMIRQGSPTKGNFEKLHSISAKNSRIINPKSSRIKQKTLVKPVASIEFNPLEPVEVSFGEIWSFEEYPEEEINTMDSPIKDQKISRSRHLSSFESPPVRKDKTIKKGN